MDDRFVPEIRYVEGPRVACDGSAPGLHPALGHPKVYLHIDEKGYVDCGYCDRRFVLKGGVADSGASAVEQTGPTVEEAALPGDKEGSDVEAGVSPDGAADDA
jgi:uncharacterized Zn-finger protein